MYWKIRDRKLELDRVLLMGIINTTPDSFSDGNQFLDPLNALQQAKQFVANGADIIDLGAESTRPKAQPVSIEDELERLLPVLKKIRQEIDIPISIDTTKPEVAKECLALKVDIINDVSGLKDSGAEMASLVKESGAGIVLMHRRGNSETMQSMVNYADVVSEVIEELNESIDFALKAGITRDQIVVDPGIGFAKTADQSLELIARIDELCDMGFPVLFGPSRKSFIGHVTGKDVRHREFGTAAASAIAVLKGAQILRVHHLSANQDAALMSRAIKKYEKKFAENY